MTFLLPSEDLRCVWIPDTCKRGRSCNQVPSVSAPQLCLAGRELEAFSPGPHVGEVRPFTDPHGHWLEPEVLAPRPGLFPSGRASSLSLTCWCLPRPLNPVSWRTPCLAPVIDCLAPFHNSGWCLQPFSRCLLLVSYSNFSLSKQIYLSFLAPAPYPSDDCLAFPSVNVTPVCEMFTSFLPPSPPSPACLLSASLGLGATVCPCCIAPAASWLLSVPLQCAHYRAAKVAFLGHKSQVSGHLATSWLPIYYLSFSPRRTVISPLPLRHFSLPGQFLAPVGL